MIEFEKELMKTLIDYLSAHVRTKGQSYDLIAHELSNLILSLVRKTTEKKSKSQGKK